MPFRVVEQLMNIYHVTHVGVEVEVSGLQHLGDPLAVGMYSHASNLDPFIINASSFLNVRTRWRSGKSFFSDVGPSSGKATYGKSFLGKGTPSLPLMRDVLVM